MGTEIKVIGVHDRCTFKPMLVFRVSAECEQERRILARAGFGLTPEKQEDYTFFCDLNASDFSYDPYKLEDQYTMGTAARHIRETGFDALEHGAFLDCEHIRGETDEPMTFEQEFDLF